MAQKTVTIDESYFRTLLRRAELHASDTADDPATVRISKNVHDELLRDSREYHVLRQALCRGGVAPETIDVLVQDEIAVEDGHGAGAGSWRDTDQELFEKQTSYPVRRGGEAGGRSPIESFYDTRNGHSNGAANGRGQLGSWLKTRATNDETSTLQDDMADDQGPAWSEQHHRKITRNDNTLLFKNLPDGVTHKDVTNAVRGGRLVDVWIRRNDRAAQVTFAEGAADFLAWSRRNDLLILGRRVDVGWSDRQFTITSQLASKLGNGHSRNLVLRGAAGRLTETQVREDMEHIHNLVISAVVWKGHDLYVSTNSIDKATFARNCMLSRLQYKGLKIEWYSDECAEPLPKAEARPMPISRASAPVAKPVAVPNRFDLLSLGDDNDSSKASEADDASRLSGIPLRRSMDTSNAAA